MADHLPLFPKATSMYIHSGNVINWNRLKRKPNMSPTDELCDCVSRGLDDYLQAADKTQLQYVTEVYKVNTDNVEVLNDAERHEVKVTVKVFICVPQSPAVIAEAINKVLSELNTTYVETLLLAISPLTGEDEEEEAKSRTQRSGSGSLVSRTTFPLMPSGSKKTSPKQSSLVSSSDSYRKSPLHQASTTMSRYRPDTAVPPPPVRSLPCVLVHRRMQVTLETIQPYWEVMEELVSMDKVLSLGVCDLNKDMLEELHTWAKVKPCINQVNLESCCVMPKDLTDYAKAINIQLLTHNDSPVFLDAERLQDTVQSVSSERDAEAWVPQWAVRYSGIIKCRGIIKMKGYVFHAARDNKKRLL